MKIDFSPQGTREWLQVRVGIPSASEFKELVKNDFTLRDGETPKTYLARKLAEKWLGEPIADDAGWAAEQGTMLESEALPRLACKLDKQLQPVGFCIHDDGKSGCSPDTLFSGEDLGAEVKCFQPVHHCKVILGGIVPKEILPQIHFSMHVTGFSRWIFYSYSHRFPSLLLTVERDEKIQSLIRDALDDFHEKLDAAFTRLCEINGGPPKVKAPPKQIEQPVNLWPNSRMENVQ